jgi:hypothetical protein
MIYLLVVISLLSSQQSAVDIALLRKTYFQVAEGTVSSSLLKSYAIKNLDDPTFRGYFGAAACMSAEETINPASKLSRFNEGRNNLEKAISLDGKNIDLRFLRYTVQCSAPSFLGYSSNKTEDRKFLIENVGGISDNWFKQKVNAFLEKH